MLGFLVGQLFDGTTVPLFLGFTIYGTLAFVAVMVAERGRLFGSATPGLAQTGVADAAH